MLNFWKKNLKIFGSPIHDTALIVISTSTFISLFYFFTGAEIQRKESLVILIISLLVGGLYWSKEYNTKK